MAQWPATGRTVSSSSAVEHRRTAFNVLAGAGVTEGPLAPRRRRHFLYFMGKNKNKDQAPNPNNVSNRDIIQRLNFLYQASVFLNAMSSQPQPCSQKRVTTSELSRSYIDTMKTVGKKTNVRMFVTVPYTPANIS